MLALGILPAGPVNRARRAPAQVFTPCRWVAAPQGRRDNLGRTAVVPRLCQQGSSSKLQVKISSAAGDDPKSVVARAVRHPCSAKAREGGRKLLARRA